MSSGGFASGSTVIVGVVQAPFGVKGWVKLRSYTDPIDNIFKYSPWIYLVDTGDQRILCEGRRNGDGLVARFKGIEDRDAAVLIRGKPVYADRSSFPQPAPGEYYWADLIGLTVTNTQDIGLGIVSDMMSTGAHDVMIVTGNRERLIPFVKDHYVKEVNLDAGYILVDWDEEF
ncbi:MAG: ribosome maturation factor RimM [Methylococcaceae bacterium]